MCGRNFDLCCVLIYFGRSSPILSKQKPTKVSDSNGEWNSWILFIVYWFPTTESSIVYVQHTKRVNDNGKIKFCKSKSKIKT